jgi:hypothetical protein
MNRVTIYMNLRAIDPNCCAICHNRRAIGMNHPVVHLNRLAISLNRRAISMNRPVIHTNRSAIYPNRAAIEANRHAKPMNRRPLYLNRRAIHVSRQHRWTPPPGRIKWLLGLSKEIARRQRDMRPVHCRTQERGDRLRQDCGVQAKTNPPRTVAHGWKLLTVFFGSSPLASIRVSVINSSTQRSPRRVSKARIALSRSRSRRGSCKSWGSRFAE